MRIAILTSSVSRRGAGVFDAVLHLAQALQAIPNCTVRVLGLRDSCTEQDLDAWSGVSLTVCDPVGPSGFGFAPNLLRHLRSEDPEILHTHGLWMYPSAAGTQWAKNKRPYIVSPHGMLDPWAVGNSRWKKRLAGALYEHRHLRGAACLHALNHAEAEAFRAYGLRNPVCVIPNGVEVPVERAAAPAPWKDGLPEDAQVLFYIGRLHPKKGLEALVRAWSMVRRDASSSGWHLAIAGWGQDAYEQELRALVSTQGLNESVHFLGPQFGELKAACFQAAAAFILPSVSEGLPMTVLEAWAHGLPVLMTPQCNLPYGFQAGAALRIEPEAASIAEGLGLLFQMSDSERSGMGARGLALVKERYHWPTVAAQMVAVYTWVLGAGPAPDCLLN
jgi:poly(glycerol-phosphate) alpha-glucosyltransferase